MVIVYAPNITDRLSYILDEIFTYRLGVSWVVTSDPKVFQDSEYEFKINYSLSDYGGITVPNSGFLDDNGIFPAFKPALGRIDYHPVLFPEPHGIGFDVFAMAFWCLSRYEEYQSYQADEHGRFNSTQSLFFTNGFLEAPVLDIALDHFYQKAGLLPPDKYAVYPTLDIDMAFKHKGKGWRRTLLHLSKSLAHFNLKETWETVEVNFGMHDPWDTFDWFTEVLLLLKDKTRIFIHAGQQSPLDKPVDLEHKLYGRRISALAQHFSIGIHPSYRHGNDAKGIASEREKLEFFLSQNINRSRHHFLRMDLPKTYRDLLEAGITHDYTMGFADQVGFRAGTGHSFRFYDLEKEQATKLVVHPFCAMDVSLKNYLGYNVDQAVDRVLRIKELCARFKVPFCFIFHNESLSDHGDWKGWRKVFETCLK